FPEDGTVTFIDFGCVQRFDADAVEGFRNVRRYAKSGARGAPFRGAMRQAYGIHEDLDEEQWEFLERYVLCCFEPALADRPYRFDRAYTQRLLDLSIQATMLGARKITRSGIWEAK